MLPVKRGISSLAWASSSRGVFNALHSSGRRFYAENGNKDPGRKSVYASYLREAARDEETSTSAQGNADKELTEDILAPQQRTPAPAEPPRASHNTKVKLPGKRVAPAPLVARVSTVQSSQANDNEQDTEASENDDNLDEASRRAKGAVGGNLSLTQPVYRLSVSARSKNCIMTLIDENVRHVASISSGRCGFRNSTEGTYEAGYQCAVFMFNKIREVIEKRHGVQLEISFKGFGQGRSALLKALTMSEGDGVRELVTRLTDKTPIKVGGVRLQKSRRL